MTELVVGIAQAAPSFLDARATTERVMAFLDQAHEQGVGLLAFGETFLPGYPAWLSHTDGARFEDPMQKAAFAAYLRAAVTLDGPELSAIEARAKELGIYTVIGVAERGVGTASGSIYCSVVSIHPESGTRPVHRKLVPTFEERLVWCQGDGHGLRAHDFGGTRVSALNCWENWMPQARHAMYSDGTQVHVALWPGAVRLTQDLTRFIAREGRVYCISASGLLQRSDIPASFPVAEKMPDEVYYDGGSAIAGPDGEWLMEPVPNREGLLVAELDLGRVAEERQNFDATGHYARPDVFDVNIDRSRRAAAKFSDDDSRSD